MESIMTHMKLSKKEALARAIEFLDLVGIPSPESGRKIIPIK